ncbi:MAG TPA: hypothetical protein DD791_09915 [Syntrophomonas sp.]|jgi:DNA repair protein RadC|nr:hypothetical protein [Syntrophomonas sp.]
MKNNLFYGGEVDGFKYTDKEYNRKTGSYYWVTTRLLRESGPWPASHIKTPEDVYELAKEQLDIENLDREHFIALYLNRKGVILAAETISVGGLHSSIVHPREVFKPALLVSAASIIVLHNHPSGDPTPSQPDIDITNRLIAAGEVIGIEVIDHVVIGHNTWVSLKARGFI